MDKTPEHLAFLEWAATINDLLDRGCKVFDDDGRLADRFYVDKEGRIVTYPDKICSLRWFDPKEDVDLTLFDIEAIFLDWWYVEPENHHPVVRNK